MSNRTMPTFYSLDQSGVGQPEHGETSRSSGNAEWDQALKKKSPGDTVENKKPFPLPAASSTPLENRPLLEELYPTSQKKNMPELYKYLRSNLTQAEIDKYKKLSGEAFISALEKDGKLEIHGEASSVLRGSLVRISKSNLFRKALIAGIAADKKYDIYADTRINIQNTLSSDGTSVKDVTGSEASEWMAWSLPDSYESKPDDYYQDTTDLRKKDRKYDMLFDMSSIVGSSNFSLKLTPQQQKKLDYVMAHEFSHATIELTDGVTRDEILDKNIKPDGKVGPTQVFAQDVMIDLGDAADKNNVGTYMLGEFDAPFPDDFEAHKGKTFERDDGKTYDYSEARTSDQKYTPEPLMAPPSKEQPSKKPSAMDLLLQNPKPKKTTPKQSPLLAELLKK